MPPSLLRPASIALALVVGCAPTPADHAEGPRAPAATPYAAVADGATLVARNDAQAFVARFDGRTVDLAPSRPGAQWTFSLGAVAFGCAGDARAVAPPSAPPRAAGSRIDVARADVSEWYVNGAAGLEQGFTLAARPASCGGASVLIAMTVDGSLHGALEGDAVVFADARGARVLGYGALSVRDADGRDVPARLEVAAGALRIVVDDHAARYPLAVDPLITNQSGKLIAGDGVSGDAFGSTVALSGDTMVVGAPDEGAGGAGAAYVFVRSGTSWTQQAKLTVAGTTDFGGSVAIAGDTIVVGAPYTTSFAGAAYVFARSGTSWTQQASLSHAGMSMVFGSAVAVHGDMAVVGASGTMGDVGGVYLFTRAGVAWTFLTQLNSTTASPGMQFGTAIAFDGTTIVVGSTEANVGGVIGGQVDMFTASCLFAGSWNDTGRIVAPDENLNSNFGASVAVDGDTVLIGAPTATFVTDRGAAYVFRRTTAPASPPATYCPTDTWTLETELMASDAVDHDEYGTSVALSGDRALIGAQKYASYTGSGYYLTRTGTTWTERTKLLATDPGFLVLGSGAALGADYSVLGARNASTTVAATAGAVYLFSTSLSPNGAACSAATSCSSGYCVDGVCCNTACGGGATTDCQACSVAAGAATAGACSGTTGGTCDDANACTTGDTCSAGACAGTARTCTPPDGCHTASCDATSGSCVAAARTNGTMCSDGNSCTVGDTCQSGACASGALAACAAPDECHVAGACVSPMTTCVDPIAANGTPCTGGTCVSGVCTRADSGVAVDAGSDARADVGTDASTGVDTGVDASTGVDTGVDASVDSDAGTDAVDAGVDAGTDAVDAVVDAGTDSAADSSVTEDTSAAPDVATASDVAARDVAADAPPADGSTHATGASGCSCRVTRAPATAPSWLVPMGLGALAMAFRRRRRASACAGPARGCW